MQTPFWTETMDGKLYYCVFLKKVIHKEVQYKSGYEYSEIVTKSVRSDNVTYKVGIGEASLQRIYQLIKTLPKEHIPDAVELYLTTRKSMQEATA